MKAATYVSAGNLQLIDQPKPVIKIQQMQLCGSWKQPSVAQTFTSQEEMCLLVKKARFQVTNGSEFVEEVGDAVTNFKVGDKVIISCVTACNTCYYCKRSLPSHCEDGGWILGHLINGT